MSQLTLAMVLASPFQRRRERGKTLHANQTIKINAKYQITIPKSVRKKLNVKADDSLLVDVQDGMMILIPQGNKSAYLRGLHSEIWNGLDVQKYVNDERRAWND